MTCYGHWDLDLDLGDGDTVQLCARYSGNSRQLWRICEFCVWNRDEDDGVLEYGKHIDHRAIHLAEGIEWL